MSLMSKRQNECASKSYLAYPEGNAEMAGLSVKLGMQEEVVFF